MTPLFQSLRTGESATFTCASDRESKWYFHSESENFSNTLKNVKTIGFTILKVEGITTSNRGVYHCQGWAKRSNINEYDPFSAVGVLKVISKFNKILHCICCDTILDILYT